MSPPTRPKFSVLANEMGWEERLQNDLPYFVSSGTLNLKSINAFTARCTIVQSALAIACHLSVRLSVTLVDHDHIG